MNHTNDDGSHGPQNDGGELADAGDDHAGDAGINGTEGDTLGRVGDQTEDDQMLAMWR